jgi:hypothetical protein
MKTFRDYREWKKHSKIEQSVAKTGKLGIKDLDSGAPN